MSIETSNNVRAGNTRAVTLGSDRRSAIKVSTVSTSSHICDMGSGIFKSRYISLLKDELLSKTDPTNTGWIDPKTRKRCSRLTSPSCTTTTNTNVEVLSALLREDQVAMVNSAKPTVRGAVYTDKWDRFLRVLRESGQESSVAGSTGTGGCK